MSKQYAETSKYLSYVLRHDGDSDSTGLIAGHLLGAMQGRSVKHERWLVPLEFRALIEDMADDLATAGSWRLGDWLDSTGAIRDAESSSIPMRSLRTTRSGRPA